ncbi:MAG: ABC transporter permease [Janthinobacterium lividum]
MTWRDWRAGELTTLLIALVVGVAALSSVGFVADRLGQGLDRDARQMIGADLRVRGDQPLPAEFVDKANALGLRTATTEIFPSMVSSAGGSVGAPGRSRLAAVKAVSPAYPLRGAVQLDHGHAGEQAAAGIPAAGTVWVDAGLLEPLGAHLGDTLRVGSRSLLVTSIISRELDRGVSFVNFSPRLMLNQADLPSTGLIVPGSRVVYRLLVAGPDKQVAAYQQWAQARINTSNLRGVAVETLQDGEPQVRETLERAHHFLSLVAMLTALLAAVAVAMSADRYARRHIDGCAVMRCLGVSQGTLRGIFTLEFFATGIIGGVVGVAFGFVGHLAMLRFLSGLLGFDLPLPGALPALQGLGTGLVLLLGFALPPLLPLSRVPPLRVIRRELGAARMPAWIGYGIGIVLFALLLVSAAGEWRLGGIVALGFAGGAAAAGALAFAAVRGLAFAAQRLRPARASAVAGFGWRYALASLGRRSGAASLQVSALGVGLMCLLLLGMTRHDLIAGWRASTPPDAPNQFVIDIQPDQQAAVQALLTHAGISGVDLEPMIRGRLVAISGQPVRAASFTDSQTRRLVEREFNLSYTRHLPSDNRLVAGNWFGASDKPQISIEEGLAKSLHVKAGDTLRFDVTGQTVEAPITSVRKVDWGTFRVNFFVLMPPPLLHDFPASFITSFRQPPGSNAATDALVRAFPNLTVIDMTAILAQLQRVLEQVIGAVQFLFLFTLAAGLLVLYAALAATRDERARECALLRALGAAQRQIVGVQIAEFVIVGALAGLMAALGAQAIGAVLAQRVFQFELQWNVWLIPGGLLAGIACTSIGGYWALRRVLRQPALYALRAANA